MFFFKKKCILFLLGTVLFILGIQSCKEDKPNTEVTKLTNQEIAKKENAPIGEYNKVMRVDISATLDNGQYIVLNIVSIKKYNEFKSNNNKILNNVIVIENVTPMDQTKVFLEKVAFFSLYDEYGNSDSDIETYSQTGKEYSEIILVSKQDINKFKYLLIGGFDSTTNDGKTKLFEINN